jgi:diguanylate cyclase (GGDEF)-like protein
MLGFLMIGIHYRLEWAFPLLAGFYLASGSGFALGFSGAILVEVMGLLMGRQSIGSLYTNGAKPLWTIPKAALPGITDWSWFVMKVSATEAVNVLTQFAKTAITSGALIVQPLVWGVASALVGASAEKRWRNIIIVFATATTGLFICALVVGSIHESLPGGISDLGLRAALGLGVAFAAVSVTMFAQGNKTGADVETASVTTGSMITAGPGAPQEQPVGSIDSLTGLFRREHLEVSLPARIEAADQSKAPLAFCMIDLDRFKQVNDTKGHQAGDRVLKDVAGILRSVIGAKGDVVRYGGDEFCVILPGTDAEEARQLMNKAAADLEAFDFSGLENVLRPTFSIGIAEYPRMAAIREDLVEKADQALYLSKNMGRNTTTIYGEQVFREQAMELTCWMAMQCFLTVNGRIRADSWRLHESQGPIEIVTAFDYTATIPYVSKTASIVTEAKTYKSSFEGKILKILSMSDNQTQFILLVQREDLPIKIKEHVGALDEATVAGLGVSEGLEQMSGEVSPAQPDDSEWVEESGVEPETTEPEAAEPEGNAADGNGDGSRNLSRATRAGELDAPRSSSVSYPRRRAHYYPPSRS